MLGATTPSSPCGALSSIEYGGLGFGSSESARNLGILAGVRPSCINQVPPSQLVIQPPAVVLTIPGPILSASCEPVAVGGNAPCAVGGVGIAGGFGHSGFGFGNQGFLGRKGGYLGINSSICCRGCYCEEAYKIGK
ncbi:hypothetical protein JD844_015736 [Phrynosoma platyrhinos]|uniref:Beta-keratin-like protein n=1 Tax=Phrynosoma platyrhinos TaxID=52577 RepID=A0ABQ7SJF2_PHRPL|nr:hypothetical protein JD844_015736 [Phrynosoma platyrhinos]